jgi:RecA-family ATPase
LFTPGVVGTHFRLDDDNSISELDDTIRELSPVLVILDPLANMHSLEDENNAAGANKVLERIRYLRDLRKTSFMVVHHLRKAGFSESGGGSGQRMRGSSVFWAKSECALYVERTGNIIRLDVESKVAPARTIEIKYAGNQFLLEDETGEGIE